MNLTAANTAIVLDSTADVPDAAERFPNWRVVPLYVRFGDESFKDGVEITSDEFYGRLRHDSEFPRTSQPTPADFVSCYRELTSYERIFSLHLSAKVSGTFASAESAAEELGHGVVHVVDTETASASIAMLALAIQRRLERGLDRGGAVTDRRDYLDLLPHAEHQLERFAKDLVVLDEHDPHKAHAAEPIRRR